MTLLDLLRHRDGGRDDAANLERIEDAALIADALADFWTETETDAALAIAAARHVARALRDET